MDKAEAFLEKKPDGFLVVGLGASAGGIQALKEFFQHVPSSTGMAYVVILHLSPDHDSQLAQVLQVVSTIPVLKVMENTKIEPDHIYVVPPNQHLVITDDSIAPSVNVFIEDRRAPVDIFFRNLADTLGPRAVGVVLSGTGANGSMGLKRIKERGGVVFVQSPREAEFAEMPRNSIATELVDEVLPVAEIPGRIIAYRDNVGSVEIVDETKERSDSQQQALREVFTLLRMRTGHDFSNYKRPTLLRRIERRINIRNLTSLQAYAEFLRDRPDECVALLKDLLISVTNFFRDSKAFQTLEQLIIPTIFRDKKPGDDVRIWVAGCATGEEAYSVAMLCAERTAETGQPKVQVFATDIDDAAISVAREGYYTLNDVADVSPERLRRFFKKDGDGYRVHREIREMVIFANHNFLKDPPFSHLDLVTCRNVLIYLNSIAQERVMETFHFSLKPRGYLFLGSAESVEGAGDLFTNFDREHHIFQAREVATRHFPVPESVPNFQFKKNDAVQKQDDKESRAKTGISFGELHQKLLEQYAAPSVVINQNYDIVHLSEKAGRYFVWQGGEPTKNLLKSVRAELRLELRSALHQAVQNNISVEARNLKLQINGQSQLVNIQIRPVLQDLDNFKGFILVIFNQKEDMANGEPIVVASDEPIARQLEEELIQVKTQLRNSIEQHEYQAEELKASAEELQAMNEELRSAVEELETSKEELQSMNEELRTVNQELKIKVEETSVASNNLENLINSANVATIFLDRNFSTRMFTPAILDIFNLISADFGRSISDITHKLQYEGLLKDAETVLEKLTVVEREVSTIDNRWYMMRILPYRTAEDRINGVVITFFNITSRKEAEKALEQSEQHLRLLIESATDYAIFTQDTERRITKWNSGAELMMGYTESEIIGKCGDIIFTREDRDNKAPEAEAQKADKEGRAQNERWHVRKDRSRFWGSGSVNPLRDNDGKLLGFVKIMRDLTRTKEAEERLQLALKAGKLGTYEYDFQTGEYLATPQHKANFGYKEDDHVTFESLKEHILPDDRIYIETSFNKKLDQTDVYSTEYRTQLPDGEVRWIRSVGRFMYNENGEPKKMVGMTLDITEEKMFTEELTRQVKERTMQLQQSNKDLQQFAHVASHDLKEPVRKIQTFNNRVLEEYSDVLPQKAKTYLDKVGTAAHRMVSMIEGVLLYSKLGNMTGTFEPVDLNEVIRDIKTDLEVLIQEKQAVISNTGLSTIVANRMLVYQLFYNLILNSLKFAKKEEPARISILSEKIVDGGKDMARVSVADNGIGFEPEYQEAIFETFTRLHPTDEYEGTVLALPFVKKL